MSVQPKKRGGMIGFFINNSVAANLMMLFVVVLGLVSYASMNKQIFPNSDLNFIDIDVTYFGASPKEIEESIVIKIEDTLRHLPEIKRMQSWSKHNTAKIFIDLKKGVDLSYALEKVNSKLDGISSFPLGMDPILVTLLESNQAVIKLALVSGSADEIDFGSMKPIALQIERELLDLKNVSLVNVKLPASEIAIEIDPMALRMYQLTLDDIRRSLGAYSENISAGQIRSKTGIISLRVEQQAYDVSAFENIPLITAQNGLQIKLKDVATVKDEFVEGVHFFTYSGKNATFIEVQATPSQDMAKVAESVRNYIRYKNPLLPQSMKIETIIDGTFYLDQRLSMMEGNLLQGAILVLLMLSLFLSFRLAFWVVVGLPFCFLGAVLIMPVFGVTFNIISLFAFIMVLGLVVDDAIVVGESVHSQSQDTGSDSESVETGVRKVAKPAIFGVLTTIAVFAPFLFSDGGQSALFKGIATIVIFCLIFSIIESKLILPSHLTGAAHKPPKPGSFKAKFNTHFASFTNNQLARGVAWSIDRKYSVLFAFVCALVVSASLITFGHVKSIPDPRVPIDHPQLKISLHDNASESLVKRAVEQLDTMIKSVEQQTIKEFGRGMVKSILIESEGETKILLTIPLVNEADRPYNTFELSKRWRANMPDIVALKSIYIKDDVLAQNPLNGDFGYFLYSEDLQELNDATKKVVSQFKQIPGVYEVSSTISAGKKELIMTLKPVANILGLTLSDIAAQMAQSHFGAEVERFNRAGEEVRVLVRYQQDLRASISELQYTRIYTTDGDEVMLGDVVHFNEQESVTSLRREGAKRSIYIFGSVDQQEVNINTVLDSIELDILPSIKRDYPQISTQLGGNVKESRAEKDQMFMFTIAAMLMVYILLAVPLKSYIQPLLIMSIIPFSVIGAIWGHLLFGEDFSLVSIFGLVAAAGVVVNDSLILVDRINQKMTQSVEMVQGIIEAVCERFRAILLTSLTTFVGLLPIMFETSVQAKFVTPMAISLGFSVLFATAITLFLIPCLYVAGANVKGLSLRLFKSKSKVI
ncbi:MAG: efflux RND transporter permease subunit [Algicola sp.]|nr:efflux RND transporter permease subunit [Algicola sp.]